MMTGHGKLAISGMMKGSTVVWVEVHSFKVFIRFPAVSQATKLTHTHTRRLLYVNDYTAVLTEGSQEKEQ